VLFFIGFDKLKGICETGSFEMAIQQQKLSALSASNVSPMVSSQNKIKSNPQLLSASPTSIITVIISRSYGIASLSTQLDVMCYLSSEYLRYIYEYSN
jgi:hypothetical protein